MIVEFFNRGKGDGKGPVEYMLGKNYDRELAILLSGDPFETIALIDSSLYSKKYTSGCLSFEEDNITPDLKLELMAEFEKCIFPGLDKNQYNVLWVEHRDKGRLELNFVIPNIELTTGKRLQPYYFKADQKRVDAWKTIQNLTHGFSDPDDPAKRQGLTPAKDLPSSSKSIADDLQAGIEALIGAGDIENRADIVRALEAAGLTIARQTKTSISIENPVEGGRNIRLKGGVYEANFDISRELPEAVERRSSEHKQRLGKRLEAARECYSYGIEIKRAQLAGSFKQQRKNYESSNKAQPACTANGIALANDIAINSIACADRLEQLAGLSNKRADQVNSPEQADAVRPSSWLEGDTERGQDLLGDRGEKAKRDDQWRKQMVYTDKRGLINDGSRASILQSFTGFRERTRKSIRSIARGIRAAGSRFLESCERLAGAGEQIERAQRTVERTSGQLEYANQHISSIIKAVEHGRQQKLLAKPANKTTFERGGFGF